MLAADDAIHVRKDSGIWMQTIHWVAKNVHATLWEQLAIWAAMFSPVNVYANVWLPEKIVINVCQKRLVYQPLKTVANCAIVIWAVHMITIAMY